MINKDFFAALNELEKTKGIDKETFLASLERALGIACKKQYGEVSNVVVKINAEKFTIRAFISKTVVEEVEFPEKETTLEEARLVKSNISLGEELQIEIQPRDFGRIAAQNARQVIMNQLHQAEKSATYNQYIDREGQLMMGIVNRINSDGTMFVELGANDLQGMLSVSDQIAGEKYRPGDKIKVLVKKVKDATSGAQILLSRTSHNFIKRMFEQEVPEIRDGIVEIKSIVREAGFRTKMAVYSNDDNIDAVGACVGNRGVRVNAIVNEIGGEKIDIIPWSEDPLDYIAHSLSPARAALVQVNEENHEAKVVVPDEKLSLAIGKEGQNARLAARLTGWKIDVKSYTDAHNSGMFDDEPSTEE